MKDFFKVTQDDGYHRTITGFYETRELAAEAISREKYPEYFHIEQLQMYTSGDMTQARKDESVLITLTPEQVEALKRCPQWIHTKKI